ncbi:hypothetical protein M8C21_002853 [Ambrosia artemisiifolia]|uniref:Uncharacterized protein n=1 Tax=Ambrosia artemisiifolia TaxID=4212 RepID=A0AAD5BLX1_AMBAR|nr:hypothetical protein M8C21_002853 [Ambrosia artemisiifolia]
MDGLPAQGMKCKASMVEKSGRRGIQIESYVLFLLHMFQKNMTRFELSILLNS